MASIIGISNKESISFETSSNKLKECQETMTYLMVKIMAKSELSFYGHILSFFNFKFIANGKKRPDFDLGVKTEGSKIDVIVNPHTFFMKPEEEMVYRLIHEAEHILDLHVKFDSKEEGYGHTVDTIHSYINDKGEKVAFRKKIPLAHLAMDLQVNSLRYIFEKRYGSWNKSNDFLLKDGLFPLEKPFDKLEPYKHWKEYYEDLLKEMNDTKDGKNPSNVNSGGSPFSKDGNGDVYFDFEKHGIPGSSISNEWENANGSDNMLDQEEFKGFIQNIINEAIEKSAGSAPGHHKRFIESLQRIKRDWKKTVEQFIARGITQEIRTTKRKISRRALSLGAIGPGYTAKKGVKVVAFLDCSGSISFDQYKNSINHLYKIRESTGADVWIGTFDSEVYQFEKVTKNNIKTFLQEKLFQRAGGTKFLPMFQKVKDEKIEPDCIIIFTDGYNYDTEGLKTNPLKKVPVLWVYTKQHKRQSFGYHTIFDETEY